VYGRLLDRMEARDHERARATAARLLHRLDRTTIDALTMFLAAVPAPAVGTDRGREAPRSSATKKAAKKRALSTKGTKRGRA